MWDTFSNFYQTEGKIELWILWITHVFVQDDGDQDSDGVSETLDATGFAAPLGDTFYNQSQSFSSMQGPPSQDQVFQEPLVLAGDNLVAQPRKVNCNAKWYMLIMALGVVFRSRQWRFLCLSSLVVAHVHVSICFMACCTVGSHCFM